MLMTNKSVHPSWMRTGGVALGMMAAFALVGCTSQDSPSAGDDINSSSSNTSTTPIADSDSEYSPSASSQASPSHTDSSASATELETEVLSEAKNSAECLVGEWVADNTKFASLMESDGGKIDDVTGTVVLTFTADGQTSTDYSDWTISMSQEGQTIAMVRNGPDSGQYSVESGSVLTIRETASDSTITMKIDGMKLGTQPRPDGLPMAQSTFTCSHTGLTVVSDGTSVDFMPR